ncbi:MAG: imidazole glycerol phosphate synthase subunit HisH [Colwellia sp.]|jgi:imidazole glycerol phosphate synthase, glutamine amidotransferase subunit
MNVVIVDYGMGNMRSVVSALNYCGVSNIRLSDGIASLNTADKIILPGVGSFAEAMKRIKESGLDDELREVVLNKSKPILGVCLGMQIMGITGTEGGESHGLGFVEGYVDSFDNFNLKVPHVGYNQLEFSKGSRLFSGIEQGSDFYFTHSFRMLSDSNIDKSICDYGGDFVAGFERDNIAGVQFHPELSQKNGLKLISNFLEKF